MITAEYKKDLRNNYMVIAENTLRKAEPYCIKLLQRQEIEGMLAVEQRIMDNEALFYYEITSKQSMANILEKTFLTQDRLKRLCINILQTIERAYEYLLPEDDFILAPEYIYLDIKTNDPSLCFLPGYGKGIKNQVNSLLEYLMNKVDYKDREAVVLVYQLYAISKEEGFTFSHFQEVLQNKDFNRQDMENNPGAVRQGYDSRHSERNKTKTSNSLKESTDIPPVSSYEKESERESRKESKTEAPDTDIPVMMEKIEGETEISCYPFKTYLYTGACILGGIIIVILSFATRILFNSFGNRVDYSKLFALALIILCGEGYLLNKLLDKKNRITRMVRTREYIDPRQEFGHRKVSFEKKIAKIITGSGIRPDDNARPGEAKDNAMLNQDNSDIKPVRPLNTDTRQFHLPKEEASEEEDYNPTCVLNAPILKKERFVLKAIDEAAYKDIPITDFPFFIGKLKKNVDYCLENEAVSRYHAKISREEDSFFLTDLNSTNGTFVNQEALPTYQKKEIKFGDEIAFANIKYRFMQQ
jgi:hypothetical protein